MSELWDVYTEDRKLTGKVIERGTQKELLDDEFHLWIMCFIKNPVTGKYLISQRSADKDTDPLKWETVAGHVIKGETSLEAALREVREEVGIYFKPEDARLVITKVAETIDGVRHNWIRDTFYFETTQEPDHSKALTPDEVIQSKWVTFDEFKKMYEGGECCLNMGDLYGLELNPVPEHGYKSDIGKIVKGKVDRPMGSYHPRKHDLFYPVNYGYVEGVIGGDGSEQDIYILGTDKPLETFTAKIIAVLHRYDDNETKWIAVPVDDERQDLEGGEAGLNEMKTERSGTRKGRPGAQLSNDEIYAQIAFVEQFFTGVLLR